MKICVRFVFGLDVCRLGAAFKAAFFGGGFHERCLPPHPVLRGGIPLSSPPVHDPCHLVFRTLTCFQTSA
jgi:hypothetical protein